MTKIVRDLALLVAAATLLQSNVLGAPPQSKAAVKDQEFIPLLAAPLPKLPNGTLAVAQLGSPDYGQLPAGPGNYEILTSKVIAAPDYQYTLPDGQLRMVISDIKITVQRIKTTTNGGERIWTGVQAAYTQYNATQNNKRSHSASLTLFLKNAGNGPQGTPYPSLFLTRDKCGMIGRIVQSEVFTSQDVYDLVVAGEVTANMRWNYEGGC
ncbi:MAG: hypothetical protein ACN6PR_18005 [Achromobacter sp.]